MVRRLGPSGVPRRRRGGAVSVMVVAGALAGCVPDAARLRGELRRAANPEQLPKVVACWEKAFEESGFMGEDVLVFDFRVATDGHIENARLASRDGSAMAVSDSGALADCVVAALDHTQLPFQPGSPLDVEGYRIAFSDPSRQARERSAKRSQALLVGPRSDRCQGLYAHTPPRDAGLLDKLIDEARAEAIDGAGDDDKVARAYQRGFDVALELLDRLERDGREEGLPRASRSRIRAQRDQVAALLRKLGARIGCPQ